MENKIEIQDFKALEITLHEQPLIKGGDGPIDESTNSSYSLGGDAPLGGADKPLTNPRRPKQD